MGLRASSFFTIRGQKSSTKRTDPVHRSSHIRWGLGRPEKLQQETEKKEIHVCSSAIRHSVAQCTLYNMSTSTEAQLLPS
jgi:hypothetical protein